MALLDAGLPRQQAYELVQRVALRCSEERRPFPEEVRAEPEIASRLSKAVLDEAFDPSFYLRYEKTIFDRVFGQG